MDLARVNSYTDAYIGKVGLLGAIKTNIHLTGKVVEILEHMPEALTLVRYRNKLYTIKFLKKSEIDNEKLLSLSTNNTYIVEHCKEKPELVGREVFLKSTIKETGVFVINYKMNRYLLQDIYLERIESPKKKAIFTPDTFEEEHIRKFRRDMERSFLDGRPRRTDYSGDFRAHNPRGRDFLDARIHGSKIKNFFIFDDPLLGLDKPRNKQKTNTKNDANIIKLYPTKTTIRRGTRQAGVVISGVRGKVNSAIGYAGNSKRIVKG